MPISLRGDLSEASSLLATKSENTAKRIKKNTAAPTLLNGDIEWAPGTGFLEDGAEDGFDTKIKLDEETGNIRYRTSDEQGRTNLQPTGDFSGPIHVYTDGSSLGNGRVGAVGGVGVYFGPNDARLVHSHMSTIQADDVRNISEALRGKRQTNQRAELTAVARALDHVPIDRAVLIHTDSNYSIKCLTEWFQKWETQNWKNSSGKDVENKDLIEPIIARIRERSMCRAKTDFKWIKGHGNDPGNIQADILAVQGSRNSTPEARAADVKTVSSTLNALNTSNMVDEWEKTKQESHHAEAAEPKKVFNEYDDTTDFDDIFKDCA
jgi:ribonuclease HI